MNLGKLFIKSDLSARHAIAKSDDNLSGSNAMIDSFYDKFVFEVKGMCANITDNLSKFNVRSFFRCSNFC
jgi:hypothetical protein